MENPKVEKEEEIRQFMATLKIADKHTIGKIMSTKGHWSAGTSASNNAYKVLCALAALGQIERYQGYFRTKGCKSEYGEHARLITQAITEILINYPDSIIHREHTIPEVGLRPDALVLIKKENQGLCIVLEALVNETETYLQSKLNTWQSWSGATEYLSGLFGFRIPHFTIIPIREGESLCDKLSCMFS
jgi:hypothetical protein